jgi:hypothetical protein
MKKNLVAAASIAPEQRPVAAHTLEELRQVRPTLATLQAIVEVIDGRLLRSRAILDALENRELPPGARPALSLDARRSLALARAGLERLWLILQPEFEQAATQADHELAARTAQRSEKVKHHGWQ